MKKTSAAALVLGAALLAGCGSTLEHGTVTGKKYTPASSHTDLVPIYSTSCDSKGYCSSQISMWVPQLVYDAECYELKLQDGKKTGSVCVSPQEYEKTKIGDTR